jgi:hypothetical protein
MRLKGSMLKAIFCLDAAIAAAAVIDPILESLSNKGVFGAGHYTDRSNLDVVPALCVALALSLVVAIGIARRVLARNCYAPEWLRLSATALEDLALRPLLPAVFILQIAALFTMETIEQVAVAGHPLGGAVWLGGPVAISLALHAIGSVFVTWTIARILQWSGQTLADVVVFVRRLIQTLRAGDVKPLTRIAKAPSLRFLEPVLARLKGRAPPYHFA